jgi:hypothetical protein
LTEEFVKWWEGFGQDLEEDDSNKTKILDGVDVEINTSPGEFV